MTNTFGNNDRLTERINRCHNPKAALAVLCAALAIAQGKLDDISPEIVKGLLEGQEKEVSA